LPDVLAKGMAFCSGLSDMINSNFGESLVRRSQSSSQNEDFFVPELVADSSTASQLPPNAQKKCGGR
jgi:hypothetical protein